jgi:hypothetical protein
MAISSLPILCALSQNCSRSQWPRQVRNCTYHNGDGAIHDALVVADDTHLLQCHEPNVGVAVHHLGARVIHPPPEFPTSRSEIHKLHTTLNMETSVRSKKSYLDPRPCRSSVGGWVHHRHHLLL